MTKSTLFAVSDRTLVSLWQSLTNFLSGPIGFFSFTILYTFFSFVLLSLAFFFLDCCYIFGLEAMGHIARNVGFKI
jgi:hypothetical protein